MSVRSPSSLRPRGRGVSIPPFDFPHFLGWRKRKSTEPVSGVGVWGAPRLTHRKHLLSTLWTPSAISAAPTLPACPPTGVRPPRHHAYVLLLPAIVLVVTAPRSSHSGDASRQGPPVAASWVA